MATKNAVFMRLVAFCKRLNESLKNEVTAFSSRHGLQNVHQRIRLAYSGPYGLTIESVYQKGTRVMIRIPYNPCLNTSEQ